MIIQDSYFHLFGKDIPYYGILFVLGFAVAILISVPKIKRLRLPKTELAISAVFAGIGGILGAKLLSVLTSIEYIIKYHISFVDVIRNGFVFYGGLIGGALGLLIYVKVYKLPLLDYFDLYAAGVPLGHAFGRVGCLLSGCCYGQETGGAFFVLYHNAADPNTPLGTHLLPVQLIEALCLIVLFSICEILFYKTKKRGISAATYAISYAVVRFLLEFFRGDTERGIFAGISLSQYISIAIVIVCLSAIAVKIYRSRLKSNR